MLDVGQVTRPDHGSDVDPGRVKFDPTFQEEVEQTQAGFGFSSRCKIQARNVQPQESEVGGRTAVTVRTELHLPVDTPPLHVGDVWEITTTHPLSLSVVGEKYRVTAPVDGTLKTARRYEVERKVS